MIGLSYDQIVSRIKEKTEITDAEIQDKVKKKMEQLSDLISKEGAAHIIAHELNVKLYDNVQPQTLRAKIKELNALMRNVEVLAKVTRIFEIRTFKTEKREGRIASLMLGDETGVTRLVIWDEKVIKEVETGNVKELTTVLLKNGYVRENNGYLELHLGSNGSLVINPLGEIVTEVKAKSLVEKKTIETLQEGEFVRIVGTVMHVFEPKFYDACPTCNKKLELVSETSVCQQHGPVNPKVNCIVNIYFDDGTENIRVVCFSEQAEALFGLDKVKLRELRNNPDRFNEIKTAVLGKQLEISGRVNRNQLFNRLEFMANSLRESNPDELAKEMA